MKTKRYFLIALFGICTLMISCVPFLSAQESEQYPAINKNQKDQTSFDDVTWSSVNKENEKENPFVRFWGYLFREREIDSVTGDDLTVVETATFSEDEDESPQAPVGVVAVHSSQTEE